MQTGMVRPDGDFGRDYRRIHETTRARASEIMGANFFGIREAVKKYGLHPASHQVATLSMIPFSEAELVARKETHKLVAVFPLSILEIRFEVTNSFNGQAWYDKESFANARGETSWQLVRKTPVVNSISKSWPEQQALLSPDEETPSARVLVYTIVGHFLATRERLFEDMHVRCSDALSNGSRVSLGNFVSNRLRIGSYFENRRYRSLGVSSAMKST